MLWGHAHTSDMLGLSEHTARLHHSDARPIGWGWHWHISLPDRDGNGQSDGQQPVRTLRAITPSGDGVKAVSGGELAIALTRAGGLLGTPESVRDMRVGRPLTFVLSFTRPLWQLLSLMTC